MKPEIREKLRAGWKGRTTGTFIDPAKDAPDLVPIEAKYQEMLDGFCDKLSLKKRIEFGIFSENKFNAFADKFEGHYFIGINTGAYYALQALFDALLADPTVFQDIGNPKLERTSSGTNRTISSFFSGPIDQSQLVVAVDESRRRFGRILRDFALKAVVLHEAAHLLNGHIDWKGAKTGQSTFIEVGNLVHGEFVQGIAPVQHHTLEMDADACALKWGCEFTESNPGQYPHEYLTTKRSRLWWFVFAYCMLWRAMNEHWWVIDKIGGTHPPKPVRLLLGVNLVRRRLVARPEFGFSKEESLQFVEAIVVSTETSASTLSGAPPVFDGLHGALHDDSSERIAAYVECWRQLRTELQKHAWIPLTE